MLRATPPGDPICGTPNSLERVIAIRAERASAAQVRLEVIRRQSVGAAPRLSIQQPGHADPLRLLLQGAPGGYALETTDNLTRPIWTPFLSIVLGEQPLTWSDERLGMAPSRFFRLRGEAPDTLNEWASNFRLLDAQGIARDLYYHTHRTGIVVLAAGTNLDEIAPLTPILGELGRTYTNVVEIWVLLSDGAPVRSNVLAQAKSLGIGFPVLLDQYDLASRAVGLTRAGEVALVQTSDYTIAYRGEVAGPGTPTGPHSLLGQALAGLVESASVTFLRTRGPGPLLAHTAETTPVYSRDIAPVFHQYCAKCHRSDGVAPFAMTNHSVLEAWAPAIKHALLSGKMPPWHADPEYGDFSNDLSIPGHLKSALIRWIDAGAPRGDEGDPLAELPPPPAFDRWPEELGEPDALVTIPVQSIKATGAEAYRYIFTQTPNSTDVWLKAAVIRPSNYRAVHHYLVWPGRIGNSGTVGVSSYESHIAEFVPGYEPFQIPADAGIFLTRSNWVTFNLHYTPYGMETNDQPVLALWYHKTKPPKTWEPAAPANDTFAISPQARDYAVQAAWTTQVPITLHRMNPHMHLRGKRVKYEVVYPNGKREVLLSVPDYDFNWQVGYALAEPKVLPAKTRIVVTGAFDNSPQNLANPDPTARIRWGDQSSMEMFVGFIDYTR